MPAATGLCETSFIFMLFDIITYEEYKLIKKTLYSNRPNNLRTLFNFAYFFRPDAIKPRLRYLKRLIKKYKKLNN